MAGEIMVCRVCGNQGTDRCAQCHMARYCSRACQMADWREGDHRRECPTMARLFARMAAAWEGHGEAGPAPGIVQVEVLRAFTSVEQEWEAGANGYCLDCLHQTGHAPVISFFCDGCTHARICNQCEARFDFCRDCRGAPVSRRVPE
eukprot:scaffold147329_cov95-Attheya_sp.AAC.1